MYLSGYLEAKFNQLGDRDYNSSIGRFRPEDPIGFKSKDENFYRYVESNAANEIDPMGSNPLAICGTGLPQFAACAG